MVTFLHFTNIDVEKIIIFLILDLSWRRPDSSAMMISSTTESGASLLAFLTTSSGETEIFLGQIIYINIEK